MIRPSSSPSSITGRPWAWSASSPRRRRRRSEPCSRRPRDARRGPALSPCPWRMVRPHGCSRNAGRWANSRDDVVIQTDGREAFAPEERHSLLESARLCEMIVEANPADAGALETLKETYTKLGDRDKLTRVVSALAVLSGVRASVGVAASKADEVDDVSAGPAPRSARSAGAPPERRMGRLGDRLIAEGLITREQLAQALAVQKGTRDKVGTILVR